MDLKILQSTDKNRGIFMPGFTTHYLFGIDAYTHIPCGSFRDNLKHNHSAFALGLQGLLDTTFLMYCSQSDRRTREITDDTVRSIVQQFMYGIYS